MTTTVLKTAADRAGYIAGLRALADALDANPTIPLPYDGTRRPMRIFVHDGDVPAVLAAVARTMTGTARKVYDDDDNTYGFDLVGEIHGLKLEATAPRSEVCERIVVGTREVTREIPDPEALAAVPTTTVTETVEDVEWRCAPLLASEPVSA